MALIETDLSDGTNRFTATDDAVAAAEAAARTAAVRLRQLSTLSELADVDRLFQEAWGGSTRRLGTELLRAMVKAGNYVGGAFADDELVGACVGFFAPPAHRALHSHITGVSARMRGRNVGFALKLQQRAWALARGVGEISWTFDPLVRRNAYFNVTKLAAQPTEYLTNFYGRMYDDLNGSDESDRLLVTWRLDSPEVVAACRDGGQRDGGQRDGEHRDVDATTIGEAGVLLAVGRDGRPSSGSSNSATVLVAVPADIERLRATDPACAAQWRSAVREVLGGLLADGARVRAVDGAGWYVVDRKGNP